VIDSKCGNVILMCSNCHRRCRLTWLCQRQILHTQQHHTASQLCLTLTIYLDFLTSLGSTHAQVTHTHPFNGPFSGTTRVSLYQKGQTNLDFTEARDSEWHWHQLGHMQVCISLQTDNHASTPPLSFLQAGCPSCCPTNSHHHREFLQRRKY